MVKAEFGHGREITLPRDNDEGAVELGEDHADADAAGLVALGLAGDIDVAALARGGQIVVRLAGEPARFGFRLRFVPAEGRLHGELLQALEALGRLAAHRLQRMRLEANEPVAAADERAVDVGAGRQCRNWLSRHARATRRARANSRARGLSLRRAFFAGTRRIPAARPRAKRTPDSLRPPKRRPRPNLFISSSSGRPSAPRNGRRPAGRAASPPSPSPRRCSSPWRARTSPCRRCRDAPMACRLRIA